MLRDGHGRVVDYLRLSLTEHCNFRCVYCTPQEGLSAAPTALYLSRQEIVRLVDLLTQHGIRRVRLTGGEPLLRRDIVAIVQELARIPGVKDLALTTNGSLLGPLVKPLRQAGLHRLNISLDSLDPTRFSELTLSSVFEKVYEAVFLALAEGFPVKLNLVAMKGLSEREIVEFVRLAVEHPLEVRFLEFMPLGASGWGADSFVPIAHVRQIVHRHFDLAAEHVRGREVAQTFSLKEGKGRVGFIASISEPFCSQCSRLRLTAEGSLRPCLFSTREVPLKPLLRGEASDEELLAAVRNALLEKGAGSQFYEAPYTGQGPAPSIQPQTAMIRSIGG